jgi:HK97 family phage major capsid protein
MAQVAPRLRKFAPTGSNITTPSDGGYMIGKTFGDLIIRRIYETGQIIGQAPPPIPVDATGKLEFPIVAESSRVNGSRWGGVQVYRNTEAETVTATRPKLEGFTLTTHKLNGIWYASEELLRNAPAMTQLAETAFSAEMQFKIESEMWSGNGVGQCLGIFPTGGTARIVVAKETSQTAATINVANISKMWSRMPAALRNNAVWFISQEAEPQLDVLAIANQPVYMPPGGLSGRPLGLLKGRPVIVIEHAEALGTENDITLVNLRDTYLLGQQGGVSSASSIHVRFLHGETTFKWTWYVGGKPTFTVPITPLKGSTTLSPYVTLATRA